VVIKRRNALRTTLAVLPTFLVSACTTVSYDTLQPGSFTGSLFVMWVGEGSGSGGDGKFVFVPDPRDPLTFTRPTHGPAKTIRPGVMYTDGGSVPRIAQIFKGFSPWGYAPAYMVHDWVFTAHHCLHDNQSNAQYQQVAGVEFEDSAAILGEAIQGLVAAKLVQQNDVAASSITWAVSTSVARNLWNADGACTRDKVTVEHLKQIELAVPGSTSLSTSKDFSKTLSQAGKATSTIKHARVVSTLKF
jgi:hypothetical protein